MAIIGQGEVLILKIIAIAFLFRKANPILEIENMSSIDPKCGKKNDYSWTMEQRREMLAVHSWSTLVHNGMLCVHRTTCRPCCTYERARQKAGIPQSTEHCCVRADSNQNPQSTTQSVQKCADQQLRFQLKRRCCCAFWERFN